MAPPNRNQNSIKRATGTVPKVTSSSSAPVTTVKNTSVIKSSTSSSARKNTEIVAPTRRDLSDLNSYMLSVAESTKQQNSEGNLASNCFDLDHLNFQESQRSCWPVRPIPRRKNYKEVSENRQNSGTPQPISHPNSAIISGTNLNPAAIGVVIPTTPNSSYSEEQFAINRNTNRCHQFRSSSVEGESETHPLSSLDTDLNWDLVQYFLASTLKNNNKNGVDRAQSVTSIHTMTSEANTPTYEELQIKLDASARNIQNIKEQQQQLLRMQQAAKQHLSEMEAIRSQHAKSGNYSNGAAAPDYDTVEQVHEDMNALVNRMKSLTTFIQNQNELSSLLGEDGPDILAEQLALQKKLEGLKVKKQDMQNLISQLQEVNTNTERSIQSQQQDRRSESSTRSVAGNYQTPPPVQLIDTTGKSSNSKPENVALYNGEQNDISHEENHDVTEDECDEGLLTEEDAQMLGDSEVIRQKCADINAMKNQLKRLKNMMETVKLIEEKAEGKSPREIADEAERSFRNTENESSVKCENIKNLSKVDNEISEDENHSSRTDPDEVTVRSQEDDEMLERVRALEEMKHFVQDQVNQLAAERDRIKLIKAEMKKRMDVMEDSIPKQSKGDDSPNIAINSCSEPCHDLLKLQYEVKKKEFQKLCQRLDSEQEISKERIERARESVERHAENVKNGSQNELYYDDNWDRNRGMSSNSSIHGTKTVPLTPVRRKETEDVVAPDVNATTTLEARSYQSACSSGFSGRAFNTRGTDNPQFGFDNFNLMRMPSAQQWNPNCYYSAPLTQQLNPLCQHNATTPHGSNNTEAFYPQQCYQNIVGTNGSAQQLGTASNSSVLTADPVLLQQFIQTQQMLVNSVCQCNQLLWHQQREINNLQKTILMLQERIKLPNVTESINILENQPETQQLNNMFCGSRAQSEPRHAAPLNSRHYQSMQPHPSPIRHLHPCNYNNNFYYQRRNHNNLPGHLQPQGSNPSYNYQHTDGSNICSQVGAQTVAFNNGTVPATASNFLNNDGQQAGALQNGAPPIFMHHHNNTITPNVSNIAANNSNLVNLHQNCLNSPSTQSSGNAVSNNSLSSSNNNAAAAAAALNNQVPPGNRANNYWDNFRSYSRQNLLSSNSCKSNEEQHSNSSPFGSNIGSGNMNITRNNHNPSRNLQHLNVVNYGNSSNLSNVIPSTFDTKYSTTVRNQIGNNSFCIQSQSAQRSSGLSTENISSTMPQSQTVGDNIGQNNNTFSYDELLHNVVNSASSEGNGEIFNFSHNYFRENTATSDNLNTTGSSSLHTPDVRNMNLNVEINELKKKIPTKSSYNTKRMKQVSTSRQNGNCVQQPVASQSEQSATAENIDMRQGSVVQSSNCKRSTGENSDNTNHLQNREDILNEVKKDLLVNALKNDKFTSKFFESLKHDVYREVYTIIQATESHPHYLIQLFRELQLVPSADPLRNIVLQAMHDLYKHSCSNFSTLNNSLDQDHKSPTENCHQEKSLASGGRSNGSTENYPSEDSNSRNENRDENEIVNNLLNSEELRRLAYKIMFESSTNKTVEKGNKQSGMQFSFPAPTEAFKLQQESFRPNFELINHIMSVIRNAITPQLIDDTNIIRIAKLTCSSIENVSSTVAHTSPNDRILLSPKSLYRVMKSFENRDRDIFLAQYEAYLNNLFFVKISNEDAPTANSTSKNIQEGCNNPLAGSSSANGQSTTDDEAANINRQTPPCKSNLLLHNSFDLGIGARGSRKVSREECAGFNENFSNPANPVNTVNNYNHWTEPNNNVNSSQPPDLITTADVAMLFGNSNSNAYSNDQQGQTMCSNNNNVINEDLAEADQIRSNNTIASSSRERISIDTEGTISTPDDSAADYSRKSYNCENNNQGNHNLDEQDGELFPVNLRAEEDNFENIEKIPEFCCEYSERSGTDPSDEIVMIIPSSNENTSGDNDDTSCICILPLEGSATYNNVQSENFPSSPKQKSIP